MSDKFLEWLDNYRGKLEVNIIRDKYLEYNQRRKYDILNYISQNKVVRKIDVMRGLSKTHREMSTHKSIIELIKEGKIKMVKDKPYSQVDYLVINDEKNREL